jgi:GDPmannose 4,6-dehydratase
MSLRYLPEHAQAALQDFVAEAFNAVGIHWQDHTQTDATLMRPTDIRFSRANPAMAAAQLGWVCQKHMAGVVRAMVSAEQALGRIECPSLVSPSQ